MFKSVLLAVAVLAIPAATLAQAPAPPTAFAGTLVSYNDTSATITDKGGNTVVVPLAHGWTVSTLRDGDAASIKPGDFIATANVAVDDNTGKSSEVRVLEPGYRPEEGTHALGMGGPATNMMTHGTVASIAKTGDGIELTVTYPNGSRRLIVASGVKVTFSDLQDHSMLKPGGQVSGVTRKGADGVQRAARLVVSK